MTFRITGPGIYRNRKGEKVEVECVSQYGHPYNVHGGVVGKLCDETWKLDGSYTDNNEESSLDIVGVWTGHGRSWDSDVTLEDLHATEAPVSCQTVNIPEPTMADDNLWLPALDTEKAPEVQYNKTSSYRLELVSERFRALEDGRGVQVTQKAGVWTQFSPDGLGDAFYMGRLCEPWENAVWSLVPETRRVVTKLWVYKTEYGDIGIHRSEVPLWPSLGAIEGSEQESEVEV